MSKDDHVGGDWLFNEMAKKRGGGARQPFTQGQQSVQQTAVKSPLGQPLVEKRVTVQGAPENSPGARKINPVAVLGLALGVPLVAGWLFYWVLVFLFGTP